MGNVDWFLMEIHALSNNKGKREIQIYVGKKRD